MPTTTSASLSRSASCSPGCGSRCATRRWGRLRPPVFTSGDLRIDLAARLVTVAGQEVHLTPIEFKVLAFLVRHAGKVVTHRQILREVWGPEYGDEAHYLRVYMAQLRRKLESDPARPRWLRTEVGVGYRLQAADDEG